MELSELNVDNIGNWPPIVKLITIALVAVLIMIGGIYFDTQDQMAQLNRAQENEKSLRQTFQAKAREASNLNAYKSQLVQIKKTFGTLLRQLPETTEVPGLLEDISKTGISNGLEFSYFKPMPEVRRDFYAELPIKITVQGNYHQLANFVSGVAALPRIVTLHDFVIREDSDAIQMLQNAANLSKTANQEKGIASSALPRRGEKLVMDITAKTYRYTE